jgi:hypothetical protein
VDGWNWLVDKTGVGSKANRFESVKGTGFQKSEAGPIERALLDAAKSNDELIQNGSDLIDATLKNVRASSTLDEALQAFSDGTQSFKDIGSWSEEFKAGIVKAASEIKAKEKGAVSGTGGLYNNIGAGAPGASGLSLPSSASYNTQPVSSYGPPVTVNQSFETGVTAQDLRRAAQTIKTETIAAVQTKVAQGGNYRREIQC